MASVTSVPKQSQGHYIVLSNFNLNSYTPGGGSGANAVAGSFTKTTTALPVNAFTLLKDLGQTVVSTNRLFRKVAPVASGSAGAGPFAGDTTVMFGVSSINNNADVFVGYIELGYEGFGTADPVARFNNL